MLNNSCKQSSSPTVNLISYHTLIHRLLFFFFVSFITKLLLFFYYFRFSLSLLDDDRVELLVFIKSMHVSIPLFFVSVQFPSGYNSLGWCFSSASISLFFSYLWDVRLAKKQVSIVASALLLLGVHYQICFSPF